MTHSGPRPHGVSYRASQERSVEMGDCEVPRSESPPPPYDPSWRAEYSQRGGRGLVDLAMELDVIHNGQLHHSSPDVVRDSFPASTSAPRCVEPTVHAAALMEPNQAGEIMLSSGERVNAKQFLDQKNRRTVGSYWLSQASIAGWLAVYASIAAVALIEWNTVQVRLAAEEAADYCLKHICNVELIRTLPVILFVTCAVFLYSILLYEANGCHTRKFLDNVRSSEVMVDFIEHGRQMAPKIKVEAHCWHRHRQFGKVVTFEKIVNVPVIRCVDVSGKLDHSAFVAGKITRLEVDKDIGFLDVGSHHILEKIKRDVVEKYQGYDRRIDIKVTISIFADEPVQSVYVGKYDPTFWMNKSCFWFWTCLLFTWPYRLCYTLATNRVRFTYLKLIQIGPVDV